MLRTAAPPLPLVDEACIDGLDWDGSPSSAVHPSVTPYTCSVRLADEPGLKIVLIDLLREKILFISLKKNTEQTERWCIVCIHAVDSGAIWSSLSLSQPSAGHLSLHFVADLISWTSHIAAVWTTQT